MDPMDLGWLVGAWARRSVPVGFALLTTCSRGTVGSATGETGSSSGGACSETGGEPPSPPCPDGVAQFTLANSQTEVDALAGCVEVSGDLSVGMCHLDPPGSCE